MHYKIALLIAIKYLKKKIIKLTLYSNNSITIIMQYNNTKM